MLNPHKEYQITKVYDCYPHRGLRYKVCVHKIFLWFTFWSYLWDEETLEGTKKNLQEQFRRWNERQNHAHIVFQGKGKIL